MNESEILLKRNIEKADKQVTLTKNYYALISDLILSKKIDFCSDSSFLFLF